MKIFRTIVLFSVLLFASLLWITKESWMISQSAFALSPNRHWYILMHISIMATFALDAIISKRWLGWLVVLGSVGTLMFNMYDFRWVHNLFALLIMAAAALNIIYYTTAKNRKYAVMNCGVASMVFILGLVTDLHLFFAEVVAEIAITVAMFRRIWLR